MTNSAVSKSQIVLNNDCAAQGELVPMGKIGSTYGIHGWLKVNSYTTPLTNLLDYQPWQVKLGNKWQQIDITAGKQHGKGLVVHIAGYDNPEAARIFSGCDISVDRRSLPALAAGEFYLSDLPGLKVTTTDAVELGTVSSIMDTGATEVLVVEGQKQHLIPLVLDNYIKCIDFKSKTITVDWDPEF